MKKYFIIFICLSLIASSCNQTNEIDIKKTNCNKEIYKQQTNEIVIVKINHGKKKGKWPDQWCEGDQTFKCWKWFPKDELVKNEEIYTTDNYMIMECSDLSSSLSTIVFKIPKKHEYTNEEMELYKYIEEKGGFDVDEEIIIDEPFALKYLNASSPLMIIPQYYKAIQEENCIILKIEMTPYEQ